MRCSTPSRKHKIAVQDLPCHMHKAMQDHFKAMLCVLKYSLDTVEQRLVLKPNRKWDGSQSHEFVISGCLDSDYAKEPKDRCSVSGHLVFLEGVWVCVCVCVSGLRLQMGYCNA